MKFIIYKTSTGIILRTGECPDDMLGSQALTGETAIEGEANDETQYISGGAVTVRPDITFVASWNKTTVSANGVDTATFGPGLPNPTSVSVQVPNGATTPTDEIVTGGTFSFATPIAGEYVVTVVPPLPHMPYSQLIIAT